MAKKRVFRVLEKAKIKRIKFKAVSWGVFVFRLCAVKTQKFYGEDYSSIFAIILLHLFMSYIFPGLFYQSKIKDKASQVKHVTGVFIT